MENNNEIWKRIIITPESNLMNLFCYVIKKVNPGQNLLIATILNQDKSNKLKKEIKETYKFCFDWQDDNEICGIELFKKMEE